MIKKNTIPYYSGLAIHVQFESRCNHLRTCLLRINRLNIVYPKKYAHGFCFAMLCCGYTLTDFPISTRLTSLALWQSNDCPSASKATLTNMDKYFMWIHYERLHNHNKATHNKTVCIFLGIYCIPEILHMMKLITEGLRSNLNLPITFFNLNGRFHSVDFWRFFWLRNIGIPRHISKVP